MTSKNSTGSLEKGLLTFVALPCHLIMLQAFRKKLKNWIDAMWGLLSDERKETVKAAIFISQSVD